MLRGWLRSRAIRRVGLMQKENAGKSWPWSEGGRRRAKLELDSLLALVIVILAVIVVTVRMGFS